MGTYTANWRWAAIAVLGVILAAAYLLWLYQRVFFGPVNNPKNEKLHDLTPREILTFAPLIVLAFWIGLYPKPFLQILEGPVAQITHDVQEKSRPEAFAAAPTAPSAPLTASAADAGKGKN